MGEEGVRPVLTSNFYDPSRIVLFDARLISIVKCAAIERHSEPAARAVANARQAVIGAGPISRLPAFTSTPTSELLHLGSR